MTAIDEGPRVIDAGTPPTRFARGWHCLGLAEEFKDGEPHEIEAFGTKLVVFQGQPAAGGGDGELHVLNAYCPHMGGNLAHGTIKGDAVACPFHDWRWSGDGRCAGIPYARRVPPRARTRAWITLERNRQLFVWHDPEGNPPPPEVTIPEIEGLGSGEWSAWSWNTVRVDGSHCREIVDNIVDMAHFYYVHYAFPTYFKNVFDGHVATQYLESTPREDMDLGNLSAPLRSDASYYGPSYMIDRVWSDIGGGVEMESVLINCHYPVDENSFVLLYGTTVRKLPGMSDEQADAAAELFTSGLAVGFEQDIEVWRNKTRIDNPLLSEEDGPVYQLRRWYEQFYVDAADVKDEMVRRFEFEIDTTRANEAWRDEVAGNIAKRAQEQQQERAQRQEQQAQAPAQAQEREV